MSDSYIITRLDSESGSTRWYQGEDQDGKVLWTYPSVTSILDDAWPKGAYLMQWARETGLASQAIFEKAGEEGTNVHVSIDLLLHGSKVRIEDMSRKEKKCIMAFLDFLQEMKPNILKAEHMVVNHEHKYAGTLDLVCSINGQEYVVDYKTSSSVQESHKLQVAAYFECVKKDLVKPLPAILHLGNRTKKGWSFLEFDADEFFKGFVLVKELWDYKNPGAAPDEESYPEFVEVPAEYLIK